MKKILLFMSAVAMLAAASCNKAEIEGPQTETPSVNVSGDGTEFVAYTESATKTALDGLNTVWESGDEIDINESKYKATEAGAKSVFSLIEGENPVAPYLAGYPFNLVYNNNTPEETTLYFDFSKTHALSAGKICNEVLAIAYNKSEPSLEFKNVVSLIEFKVPAFAEDITEIKISANEPMAGQICVNYNGGVPSWAADEDGELYNELILTSAENGKFEAGATYYVPVLPGKKTNLTVRINGYLAATGKELECKRNVIHKVGTLPAPKASGAYLKGSFNGWNDGQTLYEDLNGWYVIKNFEIKSNDTYFKFEKGGTWTGFDGSFYLNNYANTSAGKGGDVKINKGTYDLYFHKDQNCIYVTTAGGYAPGIERPVRLLVNNSKNKGTLRVYMWDDKDNPIIGNWDSRPTMTQKVTLNGTIYTYYELDKSHYGKTYNYKLTWSDGDSGDVKSVYFGQDNYYDIW